MKKSVIVILVLAFAGMVYFMSILSNVSSYETISNAIKQEGRYVHIVASLDKDKHIYYEPIKDPNKLVFYIQDSTYSGLKVIYNNAKPTDFEKTEQLVIKGKMRKNHFECQEILLKCPSKYKEEQTKKQYS